MSQDCFDPELLASIGSLSLRAATIADGLLAGSYQSRRLGNSIDFADHKLYSPGDDTRHLDWKLNARTDRYFLKRFHDESNRHFHFLIDSSGSMRFQGGNSRWSKITCASTIAIALAMVCHQRGDAIGWSTFSEQASQWNDATSTPSAPNRMLTQLDALTCENQSNWNEALTLATRRLKRRTCLIILSDMLDHIEDLQQALQPLLFAGHQIFVLQILDSDEIKFPLARVSQCVDLERGDKLSIDPILIRDNYLAAFERHQQELRSTFTSFGKSHQCRIDTLDTSASLSMRLREVFERTGAIR